MRFIFIFIFIFLFCFATGLLAESTAHMDMRLLIDNSWQEVYRSDSVRDIFQSHLETNLPDDEAKDIKKRIHAKALAGFSKSQERHCLFADRNEDLRKIVQKSPYKIDEKFVINLYEEYKNKPGQYSVKLLGSKGWQKEKLATQETFKALGKLLDQRGNSGSIDDYFKVLHHAYVTHPQGKKSLDSDLNNRFIETKSLSPQTIVAVHRALSLRLWDSKKHKRSAVLTRLASRCYHELTAQEWTQLPSSTFFSLARTMAKDKKNKVKLSAWLLKAAQAAKDNVHDEKLISLVSLLVGAPEFTAAKSFAVVKPLFANDQRFFTALHGSPQSYPVMGNWLNDKVTRPICLQLLLGFFQKEKEKEWSPKLWEHLCKDYYRPYPKCAQLLFKKVMRPIVTDETLVGNPIRRKLLSDGLNTPSFLHGAHRYEFATFLLHRHPMTHKLSLEGDVREVIDYALTVYYSISPEDASIYKSKLLQDKLRKARTFPPRKPGRRIGCYVRFVLGPPCGLICSAFIGDKNATKGVVFSLKDKARVDQLEELLGHIAALKARLRTQYKLSLSPLPQLKAVSKAVAKELEKALSKGDKEAAMRLITLTLKIAALLDDETHIERLITLLRRDVFGIGNDEKFLHKMSQVQLTARVKAFRSLHGKALFNALRSIGKHRYGDLFYRKLYIPLRSIEGFYAKVGATPYIEFVDELANRWGHYDKKSNLNKLFSYEVASLQIKDNKHRSVYLDAEDAIATLFFHYYKKRGSSCWSNLEAKLLNVNFNLGVVHKILKKEAFTDSAHLLKKFPSNALRSRRYKTLAHVFLDNVAPKKRLIYGPKKKPYTLEDFFPLLTSLLVLHETNGWPLPGFASTELFEGTLDKGYKLRYLALTDMRKGRKFDGTLRSQIFDAMTVSGNIPTDVTLWQRLLTTVLLLPNSAKNALKGRQGLTKYRNLKSRALYLTKLLLNKAGTSIQRLEWLKWLCYLEASVGGLDNARGFGYESIRKKYVGKRASHRLAAADVKTLLFEEFRLKEVNQKQASKNKAPLEILLQTVRELLKALTREYALIGKEYDEMSLAAVDYFKRTSPSKILEELRPEHVSHLFYLTSVCRDALIELMIRPPAQKGTKECKEERAALALGKELFTLYAYFLPYVHGEFEVSTLMKHRWALPLFAMIDRRIKRPLVTLVDREHKRSGKTSGSLLTFLVCHNFLPIGLLEASLDHPEVFIALAKGRQVTLRTWNFHLPWLCRDTIDVGLDSLCDEALEGISMNREILPFTSSWDDGDYLEFLFGDMRSLFGMESKSPVPQNFDRIVYSLSKLVVDDRYKRLLRKLSDEASSPQRNDKAKLRLKQSLASAKTFPERVRSALADGYPYIGPIVAEKLQSYFAIQYVLEHCWQLSTQNSAKLPFKAREHYRGFYETACCQGDLLSPKIRKNWARVFYDGPGKKEKRRAYLKRKRSDFDRTISGTSFTVETYTERKTFQTLGVRHFIEKPQNSGFDKAMGQGGIELLRALFRGEGVKIGSHFIGDLLWRPLPNKKDERAIGPLPFDSNPDECRLLVEWVFLQGEKYGDVPPLRDLFLAGGDQ